MSHRGFFPGRSRRNRLRRTHLNGNPGFRNAFLMRLRRGDCAAVGGRHARGTDSRVDGAGSDHLRRPLFASGPPPMIPRGSRALRCGRHRSSQRSSGPQPALHEALAARAVTLRADLRPTIVSRPVAQPPSILGRLREGRVERSRLAQSLAPAQLARCLEGGEKGVPSLIAASPNALA